MYKYFFKRILDFLLSLIMIVILSPFFLIFTPIVAIAMGGNPFFCQLRPGKKGKIFKLIKYRSMTNKKDKDGNLLPDEQRLTKFGKFIRKTSLDELPELFNILFGQMSFIGPRPLLVSYLPYYTEEEMHRHDVRPGLTGLAQVSGRNNVSWEKRFELDVEYARKLTLWKDIKIIFGTIKSVFSHNGVELNVLENFDDYRKKQKLESNDDTRAGEIQE